MIINGKKVASLCLSISERIAGISIFFDNNACDYEHRSYHASDSPHFAELALIEFMELRGRFIKEQDEAKKLEAV